MRLHKALSIILLSCLLFTACTDKAQDSTNISSISPTASTTPQGTVLPTATPVTTASATPDTTPLIETDYTVEVWQAIDIPFTANNTITKITETAIDVVFTNRQTGKTLIMPAFWNSKKEWIVRFAPTQTGIWDYYTKQTGKDIGLNNVKGTLKATVSTSELDIYKHGFIKTEANTRYFMYDDGTPFFYLGDTHWSMLAEEFDSAGTRNDGIETSSHFKYIVDKRVEQGFTVYQSQPIGANYNVTDGFTPSDITGFKSADRYFKYIADKGLVHANAMLCFPSAVNYMFLDEAYLRALVRYWVARYSAYPVLWTLGQEVDDACTSLEKCADGEWVYKTMLSILYEVDPYKHPITAHQITAGRMGASGGVATRDVDRGNRPFTETYLKYKYTTNRSVFYGTEGHTWWGAQWAPTVALQYNFEVAKDYWYRGEGKVSVNYESRYHYLSGKDSSVRINALTTYLSGMTGYAYGAQDIWYYNSGYGKDTNVWDGIDDITKEDKDKTWGQMIKNPVGYQMGYIRQFFNTFAWHKLVPDFDEHNAFLPTDESKIFYACAYVTNEAYVVLFYNQTSDANGYLINMDKNATYTAKWYDVVNNSYTLIDPAVTPDAQGRYKITNKPMNRDLLLIVTKN